METENKHSSTSSNVTQKEVINNKGWQIRLPLIVGLAVAGGIFIGANMFSKDNKTNDINKNVSRFREILTYIDRDYVDTVNTEDLIEEAISKMLEKLDPHSVYIPAKDLQIAKSQLEGDFEGIGIEFQIIKDTIYVVTPISGGPSEAIGLKSGDKILKIDNAVATGKEVSTQFVFSKLRGPKGTKVKVSIWRKGAKDVLNYTITRDKIPTYSVDVAYMIDSKTGYIKISRFAANTHQEFKKALVSLRTQGATKLMIDLRDNPGGYLERATDIADELLGENKLIVYTNGKDSRYDQKFNAYKSGDFENGAVVVLVNEGSASASEILAGAIQDNDRGIIVGRRTFGKGLVQMPIQLNEGGELRLTISRYYTPSGRSIQKPYTASEDYDMDIVKRYKHGEFFSADSIKFNDSLKYKTTKGRIVYGGGGIMPDIFVPRDTTSYTSYLSELYNKSVLREYTLNYANENKAVLEKMSFVEFKNKFEVTDKMLNELIDLGKKSDVKYNASQFNRSKSMIKNNMKAFIARSIWKNEGFFPIINENDEIYIKALKMFDKASKIETSK